MTRITTTGIDHLGLTVPDLNASIRFFTEGLGSRVLGGDPDYRRPISVTVRQS